MALTPVFLYHLVNTFCIMFFITYGSPPSLDDVEGILSARDYFQFDSLFCIVMLVLLVFGCFTSKSTAQTPLSLSPKSRISGQKFQSLHWV